MAHAVRLHEISELQSAKVEAQEFHSQMTDLEQARRICGFISAEVGQGEPNLERVQKLLYALEDTLSGVHTFIYGHWSALTEDMALLMQT
jgi:hypothetical protein